MSSTNDEEETGCTMVYHCSKCDEATPRKDFHKMYDRIKMEDIFCKTCKECRDKVKATKELRKEQKKRIQPMEIHVKAFNTIILLHLQNIRSFVL